MFNRWNALFLTQNSEWICCAFRFSFPIYQAIISILSGPERSSSLILAKYLLDFFQIALSKIKVCVCHEQMDVSLTDKLLYIRCQRIQEGGEETKRCLQWCGSVVSLVRSTTKQLIFTHCLLLNVSQGYTSSDNLSWMHIKKKLFSYVSRYFSL